MLGFFRRPTRSQTSVKKQLRIESLEDRRVMAANVFLAGGVALPAGTGGVYAPVEPEPGHIPVVQEFEFHSLPGAAATLYLDFNGHFQREEIIDVNGWGGIGNILTPAFDRDGDPTTYSPDEQQAIRHIFSSVAEDFAPFNIDVTTVDPDPGSFHTDRPYLRVVISGDSNFFNDGDGFTEADWDGSFDAYADPDDPNVCYVFSRRVDGQFHPITFLADAASHEAGHAFGLKHNIQDPTEFQSPIMGSHGPVGQTRGTWAMMFVGHSMKPEMDIIASDDNGFGYRWDDHVNGLAGATQLTPANVGAVGTGIIGKPDDVDVFAFSTGGGNVSIQLTTPTSKFFASSLPVDIGNLDATVRLLDANGNVLAEDTDPDRIAFITTTLPEGQFFVQVTGAGQIGNMGQYTLLVKEDRGAHVVSTQQVVNTPTQLGYVITFNEMINPLTFTTADIRINGGLPGASVTSVTALGGDYRSYFVVVDTQAMATSQLRMSIGPNIADRFGNKMDQNQNGISGESVDNFMANFGLNGWSASELLDLPSSPKPKKTTGLRAAAVDAALAI